MYGNFGICTWCLCNDTFEIIDNIFQVIVFSLIIVADIVCWFLHKNRLYIILALAHSCFMMGTLYFVLYLVIRGKVPQFFYVSEISWIASYLFLHSYQIVGYKGQRMKISVIPLICGIGVAIISMGVFTLAAGAIVYISVFQILYGDAPYKSSICILLCIILQVSLYISSSFFHDYTRFNLYFCIDIVLTISMAMLLPCTFMEVGKDDVH